MLEGIRVLDLSRVIAGPYAAQLLADLGADVIKLERPGRGDDLRALKGQGGMSAVFAAMNRNKRGIAVDLQHPEGLKIAVELARRSDVVVENFVPGVADRLGIGYEAVRAANPGVIYASISGFGQSGPSAGRPGYNVIAQGMSGLMAITGSPADVATSLVAFGGICAALVHRLRTGQGQQLDVSLLASTMGLLPDPVAHYFGEGRKPGREGNRNPNLTPAEAYRTADGFLAIVLMNPEQWDRFCRVLGDEALRRDPAFATNDLRLTRREELVQRIEAILATAPTAEWVRRFEAASIACGPIYEFDEVWEDPQVRHIEALVELDQPGLGPLRVLGFPFKASETPATVRRPAPLLGEHTAEVLAELGLSPAEIERLAAEGAIGLG